MTKAPLGSGQCANGDETNVLFITYSCFDGEPNVSEYLDLLNTFLIKTFTIFFNTYRSEDLWILHRHENKLYITLIPFVHISLFVRFFFWVFFWNLNKICNLFCYFQEFYFCDVIKCHAICTFFAWFAKWDVH